MVPFETNVKRGLNMLLALSGCTIPVFSLMVLPRPTARPRCGADRVLRPVGSVGICTRRVHRVSLVWRRWRGIITTACISWLLRVLTDLTCFEFLLLLHSAARPTVSLSLKSWQDTRSLSGDCDRVIARCAGIAHTGAKNRLIPPFLSMAWKVHKSY